MDVRQASSQLVNAESVIEALSEASTMHQAESLKPGYDALKAFTNATQQSMAGDASGTGRTAGGGTGNANGFAEPVMLMASPSGIALSTQQSTHVSAEQHVNVVSGGSTHIASGKSLIASIGEKLSLFVQNAGMKLFAAKGKVEVQAHSDAIELSAHKGVKVISATQTVEMAAAKSVLLTSGGAYVRIENGNIEIHAPGSIDVRGGQRQFAGPASLDYPLPDLPDVGPGKFSQKLVFRAIDCGQSAAAVRYAFFGRTASSESSERRLLAGNSSAAGSERMFTTEPNETLDVLYGQGEWITSYELNIDCEPRPVASASDHENESGVA
jgi:type VI secretion system secreted protein VgrG